MPRRILVPLFALLAAAAITACGGDDKSASTSGGSGGSKPPAGVLDRVDLAQSVQNIQELKSFRFDIAMKIETTGGSSADNALAAAFLGAIGDIKASGAFVAPDQSDVKMTMFGQEFSYVQIGDKAWLKTGNTWKAVDPEETSMGFGTEDLLSDLIPAEVLRGAKTSREKVNGVETVRYSFDKKALEALAAQLGETADLSDVDTANLDIWLNADNIPVKLSVVVSGQDEDGQKMSVKIDMNITNINDGSIRIKPPI